MSIQGNIGGAARMRQIIRPIEWWNGEGATFILQNGEIGIAARNRDKPIIKIGNGSDAWDKLFEVNAADFYNLTGANFDNILPSTIFCQAINPDIKNTVPGTDVEVYDFDNIRFTTEAEATYTFFEETTTNGTRGMETKTKTLPNLLLEKVYTYRDKWNNRHYTFNEKYTPNIGDNEEIKQLTEEYDPDGMLRSIQMEAKFRNSVYLLGEKGFALMAGSNIVSSGTGSIAIGKEQFVVGKNASSFGMKNFVRNSTAFACGYNNTVTGLHSAAFNEGNNIMGYASFGCGDHNTIASSHSFGTGWQNLSSGQYNFVGGSRNILEGSYNIGFGDCNKYSGQHNFGLGKSCEINGLYNIINGYNIKVFGSSNIINGLNNSIGGVIKVNGIESQLVSSYNIIVGIGNKITRTKAVDDKGKTLSSLGHIINGVNNEIAVDSSYRNFINGEGNLITSNIADNISCAGYAMISGIYNTVKSRFGVAFGEGLDVQGHYGTQLAIGKYNQMDKWAVFIVGQGKSNDERKTVFTIKNDGRAVLGADPVGKMDAATKQYVDNKIVSGQGLPTVTAADNGKFLRVVSGKWAATTIQNAEGVEF